jgi:anti-sigma regulatory factor (Ser/Thr protein kinase)
VKDLSLHILDIVQNSVAAGADLVTVTIDEDLAANMFRIEIGDNGRGMTKETLAKVADPYYTSRTTRKVGMGIPLFMHTARQAGGQLQITSEPGAGTKVVVKLAYDHIDRPALGDMAGVMSMLSGTNPDMDFVYTHRKNENTYVFDTREVKQILDGMPLSELPVIRYVKEMIQENLGELGMGN